MLLMCLTVAGFASCGTVAAQSFCSEPVEPYCVSTDSEFDTLLQVNRCRDDLVGYEEQVNEYEQCITEQIQGIHDEIGKAREKLEQAGEDF